MNALMVASSGIQPDVLLINGDLPEVSDPKTWATFRLLIGLPLRITAISEGEDRKKVEQLLAPGVTCLHPPTSDPEVLCRLVRNATAGGVDIHPQFAERFRLDLAGLKSPTTLRVGELWIDLERREVRLRGQSLRLTSLEFSVPAYLARNMGRAVSSAELLEAVGTHP